MGDGVEVRVLDELFRKYADEGALDLADATQLILREFTYASALKILETRYGPRVHATLSQSIERLKAVGITVTINYSRFSYTPKTFANIDLEIKDVVPKIFAAALEKELAKFLDKAFEEEKGDEDFTTLLTIILRRRLWKIGYSDSLGTIYYIVTGKHLEDEAYNKLIKLHVLEFEYSSYRYTPYIDVVAKALGALVPYDIRVELVKEGHVR